MAGAETPGRLQRSLVLLILGCSERILVSFIVFSLSLLLSESFLIDAVLKIPIPFLIRLPLLSNMDPINAKMVLKGPYCKSITI